jgi:hypothetical protein
MHLGYAVTETKKTCFWSLFLSIMKPTERRGSLYLNVERGY